MRSKQVTTVMGMTRIFAALVISYAIVITVAFVLGLMVHDERSFAMHFGMGLFAVLFTIFLYCVVVTYFVITGKMIKQAVLSGGMDEAYIQRSQSPKSRVVRLTMLSVGATLAGVLLGAWAQMGSELGSERGTVHLVATVFAVGCNAVSFFVLYQLIHANALLVDEVFGRLNTRRSSATAPIAADRP